MHPYVLLLNPDAVIADRLDPLRAACDLPGAAGAGGKLLDAAGRPQVGFMVRRFPTTGCPDFGSSLAEPDLAGESGESAIPLPGSGLFRHVRCGATGRGVPDGAPRSLARNSAGSTRVSARCGLKTWISAAVRQIGVPFVLTSRKLSRNTQADIRSRRLPVEMRLIYWYRSLLRYSAKHFRPVAFRAVCLAVVTGSVLRIAGIESLQSELQAHGSLWQSDATGRPVVLYPRA